MAGWYLVIEIEGTLKSFLTSHIQHLAAKLS
jgi:hypothetical protein